MLTHLEPSLQPGQTHVAHFHPSRSTTPDLVPPRHTKRCNTWRDFLRFSSVFPRFFGSPFFLPQPPKTPTKPQTGPKTAPNFPKIGRPGPPNGRKTGLRSPSRAQNEPHIQSTARQTYPKIHEHTPIRISKTFQDWKSKSTTQFQPLESQRTKQQHLKKSIFPVFLHVFAIPANVTSRP